MKKVVIEMMMMMVILPKTHHKTVHRKYKINKFTVTKKILFH